MNGNGKVWADTTSNTLTVGANNGTGSFSGVLANGTATLSLTKNGTGTQILSGTNTYTGATTVNAGILQAGAAAGGQAFGIGSAVTVANVAGAALNLNSFNQTIGSLAGGGTTGGNVTLGNNATLTAGGNNTSTSYAGVISGTGTSGLTKTGSGTLILSGSNTYTGITTVTAGTLQFGKQGSLYNNVDTSWTAANINVKSGGTLAFNVGGTNEFTTGNVTTLLTNLAASSSATNGMNSGSKFGFDTTNASGGTFTIADVIANSTGASGGARGLTKLGTGILTLSNANTYSGGTTLSNGILNVANVSGLGATGSTVSLGSFGNTTTLRLSTDTAFGGANPVYNLQMTNSGGAITSTIELNRATVGASAGITHNFGDLLITLNGGSAATLNVTAGANAGGLDTIAFASMRAGNNNLVTETLNPTGGNITIGTLKAFGTFTVTMALSGTTAGNAITGVIGGTGNEQLVAITKIGTSTWTLSNAGNNYNGGTTFSGGTLNFASGALGTTGAITASGGTLQWASGNTQDISSRLAMTAVTSTFDTNGNDVTFASAIGSSVAAALTKTGTGTLTLQGTNTYTGSTTVNLGTLSLDYGTNDFTKLSNTSSLVLGGGTVNLAGATGSHVEVVSATTLTAGTGSYVTRTGLNTAVLQLGAITNNTGTLNIGGAGMATANNTHTVGTILGTWATIGGDWAITADSGTNIPITAYTGYTDVTRFDGTKAIANGSTTNVRIREGSGGSLANITVTNTVAINTLNQSILDGTSAATVAFSGTTPTLRTDGILMGPTAGALTIGASAGSGTLTPNTAGGSIIVTNNSSNTLTINSVIADNTSASRLIKTGTGVLVLTGANTYLGGTTIQDGTLRVGASTASILGGTFNNGLTIANKATAVFDLNNFNATIKTLSGGGTLGGNVTLGSGTLTINDPTAGTYSGIISGTGGLTVGGSSGWTVAGANTYTGVTRLNGSAGTAVTILADGGIASSIGQSSSAADRLVFNGGTLAYNNTSAASTNRQFTLEGGGGLRVDGAGAITWTSTAAITHGTVAAKTLSFSGTGAGLGTLAAQITDSGTGANITGVTKTGTGNWSLTGTGSTFTGAITLNTTTSSAGTLSYASAGGANAITFNQTTSTATLSYTGSGQTMSGLIQANALTAGGAITLAASGTGAINYSNTGSLGVGGAIGAKGLVLSGTNTGDNILNGIWADNTAGGAATLTKNGVGTWILSGSNTYTGATAITGGTLISRSVNALGSTLGGVNINTSTLVLQTDGGDNAYNVTVNTGITGTIASDVKTGSVGINHTLGIFNAGNGTLNITRGLNVLSGSPMITFSTVTLAAGIAGTTTLNPTTADLSLGAVSSTTNFAKTLELAGTSLGNTITGALTNGTNVVTLLKSNSSKWVLSGTNTYTGTTVINAGTLQFAKQESLYNNTPASWTAANINVKSGATFAVNVDSAGTNGFTDTNLNTLLTNISVANTAAQGLQAGATLGFDTSTATGGTFTQGNAIANSTGSGAFHGAIGVTKLGTGTLVFDKANTYTGATNVSAGTLLVNGSISTSSLTTVASGATIGGGSGTIGALTVSSGGFISGGDSAGDNTNTLNIIGAYSQAGQYTADIAGISAGSFDQINVTGAVNISGGSLVTMFTGSYLVNDLIFILIKNDAGSITGEYAGLAQGATFSSGGYDWQISYFADSTAGPSGSFTGGNDIALMAIPEPKVALLGCLGVLLFLRRRRSG